MTTHSHAPEQGKPIAETTRSTVRFNQESYGFRLIDHIEDQSPITEGSVVLLRNGRRYRVERVVNPANVTYSIAYVEPYLEIS